MKTILTISIEADVKKLSDKVLLEQTDTLVHNDRQNMILLLRHLREVEIR